MQSLAAPLSHNGFLLFSTPHPQNTEIKQQPEEEIKQQPEGEVKRQSEGEVKQQP
jgi:hypothetical protein